MQNYCLYCMRELKDPPICRHCGTDNSKPLEAEPYHLTPGTLLSGRYLVGRALGEGGFGITYIGLHTTLSKRVAVKEFYPSGAANRTNQVSEEVIITKEKQPFFRKGVERFLAEAKNIAAFPDEDGIVDVIDYFQENNTAYIVMEYLEGETLKDYTDRHGLFDIDELITLLVPMMKSLNVIHSQGVVHRDISPDNIMYTKNGKFKLMDFGSARYYTNEDRQMSIILKQGFAPEEQYRANGKQGPHTDVYALCATVYACITGKVPPSSLDRLSEDTLVPPSRLGVPIKPYQEQALMHGLAVRAADRTPDIETLSKELTTPPASAAPQQPKTQMNGINTKPQAPGTTAPRPLTPPPSTAAAYQNRTPMRTPNTSQPQTYRPQTGMPNPQTYRPQTGMPQNPQTYRPQTGMPTYHPQAGRQSNVTPGFVFKKKKSPLPIILGITIPLVVLTAAAVIVIAMISGAANKSGGSSDSGISFNINFGSSEDGTSAVETTEAADSSAASTAKATKGLSPTEAKKYPQELSEMILPYIVTEDDRASSSDNISVKNIYYVNKKDNSYQRLVYVYYNATRKYYRTIQISPEFITNDGESLAYPASYFYLSDSASTQQQAVKNNTYLNLSTKNYDTITIL